MYVIKIIDCLISLYGKAGEEVSEFRTLVLSIA